MTSLVRIFISPSSASLISSSISVLNPTMIAFSLSVSRFVLALIRSFLFIFPIPALTIEMCSCFNNVVRASKLPRESALIIIPFSSVFNVLTSFLNSSLISFKLFLKIVKGIPGRMAWLVISCILIPVAAVTWLVCLNLFEIGWISSNTLILDIIGSSKLAMAISSLLVR